MGTQSYTIEKAISPFLSDRVTYVVTSFYKMQNTTIKSNISTNSYATKLKLF